MATPSTSPILILTNEFAPTRGGIATYVEETARAAVESGREAIVWAPGNAHARDNSLPFSVRRIGLRGNQNWPDRLRLRRALRRAHVNWQDTTLYLPEPGPLRLWLYADLLGLPRPGRIVLTFHGSELLQLGRWPHRRGRLRRLCGRADRIGVVSRHVASLLKKTVPGAESKAVVVPGAPAQVYAQLAAATNTPPHNSGQSAGATTAGARPFRLLSITRVHPRKGVGLAVDALAHLPTDLRERVRYDIVGPVRNPAFAREVSRKARAHGVVVNYLGTLDAPRIAHLLLQTDLLLFPSRELPGSIEGLGLSILEAGLFRVPVVATHTGGTGEAVRDGETGLLVRPDDPAAFAVATERCLRDPALRHRLGARAATEIPRRFSWARNVSNLFG